jgi:hypothetical protein
LFREVTLRIHGNIGHTPTVLAREDVAWNDGQPFGKKYSRGGWAGALIELRATAGEYEFVGRGKVDVMSVIPVGMVGIASSAVVARGDTNSDTQCCRFHEDFVEGPI